MLRDGMGRLTVVGTAVLCSLFVVGTAAAAPVDVSAMHRASTAHIGADTVGGPAAAAAAERLAAARVGRAGGVSFAATRMVWMYATEGSSSTFSWSWGAGHAVRGYAPAVDHVTMALRGGRVVWTTENLEPVVPFTSAGIDTREPFEVLDSSAGAYGRFVSGVADTSASCAFRLSSAASPFSVGSEIVSIQRDTFKSIQRTAGRAVVSYQYSVDGIRVSETDTISLPTDQLVSAVLHTPASPAHHVAADTWSFTGWRYLSGPTPPLPVWPRCQG